VITVNVNVNLYTA